ncbi:MAG: hypothetical protein PHR96_03510 [Clostridia bacterium]|nr:hypothetical protein [Clostridia bacterium]
MKKFLILCIVVICALFVGLTTYYFLATNEKLELVIAETEIIKLNQGETFELSSLITQKNKSVKVPAEIYLSNDHVLSYDENTGIFSAERAGSTTIIISPEDTNFGPYTFSANVGNGETTSSPFYIKNQSQLSSIGASGSYWTLDKNYELTSDIYLTGIAWNPIGQYSGFTGTFNGNNHTVYGLTINSSYSNYAGLFSIIGQDGFVKNVKISQADISGSFSYAGAISGVNNGTIALCEVINSSIKNTSSSGLTGGITGFNQLTTNGGYYNSRARVELCQAINLKISSSKIAGGIVGKNYGSIIQNNCSVITNYTANSTSSIFGGIAGENHAYKSGGNYYNNIIKNCYAIFPSLENKGNIGEIAGFDYDYINYNTNTYERNYYVSSNSNLKAIASAYDNGSSYTYNFTSSKFTSRTLSEMNNQSSYIDWDFYTIWEVNGSYAKINFDSEYEFSEDYFDYYYNDGGGESISSLTELQNILNEMRQNPSGNLSYVITSSLILDLNGSSWIPIGTASSPFNGQLTTQGDVKLTIRNLRVNNYEYSGFFGFIDSGALIKGLQFENAVIGSQTGYASGIISGYAGYNSSISDCLVSCVNITSRGSVGGAVGLNCGTIRNVTVNGFSTNNLIKAVSSNSKIGGIAGNNQGTIRNCKTTSIRLEASNNAQVYAGGIAGENSGTITESGVKTLTVLETSTTETIAGGIVGYNRKDINKSYASAVSITISNLNYLNRAGGLVGINAHGSNLKTSIWTGGSINGYTVGGLCADNYGNVSECGAGNEQYGIGNLNGVYAGGLLYSNHANAKCSNSYVLANINGTSNSGGIAGMSYLISSGSEIKNCLSGAILSGSCEKFAETRTEFKNVWYNFLSGLTGGNSGNISECVIVNSSNAIVQGYALLFDQIENPLLNKYAMIFTETEAKGSANYTCYTNYGFSENIWNFNYANSHYPTLKNSPVIY